MSERTEATSRRESASFAAAAAVAATVAESVTREDSSRCCSVREDSE